MPGYVLAKLEMNDDVYHLVKNTPKVTGFLGPNGKPQPIPDAQAARMLDTKEEAAAHGPSRRSASTMRSATRSRCSTARSRASTAWSRNSISTAAG
jgi:transcription antitermination factor NusG